MWMHFNTLGTIGSENGKIMADEEYKKSCRVTLENVKDIMPLLVVYMAV